jgi:ABC-type Fe3+-hydroxamate transport system substrate-binding protein
MWTDVLGTAHGRAAADARIVSLVPSITELLFALDLGAQVVGRTGFCVHPRAAVRAMPKVGGTKDVDLARLRALVPTHVIVNVDENTRECVDALRTFVPAVIVTHPNAPEDNLALYRLFGGVFDRETQAAALCAALERELAACRAAAFVPERVLYLCWKDPWMTVAADTYIARTLAAVGWQVPHPPGGFAGAARYPTIDLHAEVARVGRVLLSSEPFRFDAGHVRALAARFPGVRVQSIDAELTSWYGVRAIAGLRGLRALRSSSECAAAPASRPPHRPAR